MQKDLIDDPEKIPVLESEELEIEVRFGERKDEENKKICQLTVELKEELLESFPYKFKIQLVGFFNIDSSCTDEETDILMTNVALSMLYTAAREYLLTITGRTRYVPLILPTVVFPPMKKIQKEADGRSASIKKISAKTIKPTKKSKKKPAAKVDNKK